LFFILIDNAIKYTPEGGSVAVRLSASDGYAVASVTDSGIGIAPEDIPRIFDRFWRADKVRSRGMGGAGLGLSIARWIVTRHQGAIDVRSSPGKGTTFTVSLPLAVLPEAAA
jgi:signal transduction histidine kinase